MRIKKHLLLIAFFLQAATVFAKDYNASMFGIYSDGSTLNTRSIQAAIDYIHENGGGRLVFFVGRYLSGSIHLKSNVTLQLNEGAVLIGSLNPYDYDKEGFMAFILAKNEHDIGVTGQGVIDGQGRSVARNVVGLINSGVLKDRFAYDRPQEDHRPMVFYLRECKNVTVRGVTIRNSASWVQTYDQCKNLTLDSLYVDSKAYWNNDGIDIVDCDGATVTNSYIDAADDGICLKSHDPKSFCNNILIRNNTIRSSANAIKFGTVAYGGFKNIRIKNNQVFDTYRSAVALESVDGGFLTDVEIDSLRVVNTGNAVFLRLGERGGGRKSSFDKVKISNVYVEIPANKADAGYEYEGPIEDMPRNISPIVIAGLPNQFINDITFTNIEIKYPGGGTPMFANVSLDRLDSIPEIPAKYPDFSMFRELPAWGVYIRHAKNLRFNNVKLTAEKKDYRMPIVLDDVHGAQFTGMKISQPNPQKQNIYQYKSSDITQK